MTQRVKARILAIDDVPANLMTLGSALSKEFTLQIASSGEMGLAQALETLPDLILLDVMMPGMDGFETFRRLRAHASLQKVPIVFVTAMHDMGTEMDGLNLGAADYITKPIRVEIARQRIRNLIERERLRTQVEQQRDLLQAEARERKLAVEALHASEEKYRLLVENSHDIIYILNSDGVLTFVSPAWTVLLGHPVADVVGQNFRQFVHPDDIEVCTRLIDAVIRSGIRQGDAEYRIRDSDGNWHWHRSTVAICKYSQGKFIGVEGIATDITERYNLEEGIRQLAFYDPLTKLPNRRLLMDRLQNSIASCARNSSKGALMFLDLDKFKPINDLHGHEVGDQLLIQVAERLRNCVREIDTVARFGGDEFVVILSDLNSNPAQAKLQAENVAEKLRSALAEPYSLTVQRSGEEDMQVMHSCSASIGVATFDGTSSGPKDIVKLADKAMYLAKARGKNTVEFCESGLSTSSIRPPIVIEQSLLALNNDLQLLKTLVHMVLHQIEADMPAIRGCVASANTVALKAATHRLKGSLGAIAATPAYEACAVLNTAARMGVVESYAQGLVELEREIDRLCPCLNNWLATQDKD